ncbi:PhoP regulatory network protein YrbL [Salinisphaera sp. C84B14]
MLFVDARALSASQCDLSALTLIGRGSKRDCYTHPHDDGLCLKVARDANSAACHEQNEVEWRYGQWLEARGVPFRHAARCTGWIQTQRGAALVVERVRNSDGTFALTLRDALLSQRLTLHNAYAMLAELRHWALTHAVVVSDLRSTNLMVRQADDMHLVFIDGLGARRLGPAFERQMRMPLLARLKTLRQWRRQKTKTYAALAAYSRGESTHQ